MLETLNEWDKALLVFLNNLGTEPFDGFWLFVTRIESWTALFVFFALLIFYFYKKKKGLLVFGFAVLAFAVTFLLTNLTKVLVGRLRPNNENDLVELLRVLQDPTSFSFFSGHASTSFAIVTFLVCVLRPFNKWIYLAFIWPLLFALSRIYVGVHYPSDILIGATVGTFIAIVCFKICKKLLRKL
ncbi:MAG: phosphatase PAP2 family protein [Bacteroidota bacterium]